MRLSWAERFARWNRKVLTFSLVERLLHVDVPLASPESALTVSETHRCLMMERRSTDRRFAKVFIERLRNPPWCDEEGIDVQQTEGFVKMPIEHLNNSSLLDGGKMSIKRQYC